MSAPRQQTIGGETTIEGIGVHSGAPARVRLRPAAAGAGLRFRRVDLAGEPEVAARLERVASTDRGTTLADGEASVATVEHLLAVLVAASIDNAVIEIDGPEVPIMDGSFAPFHEAVARCGVTPQDAAADVLKLKDPVPVTGPHGASYVAMPAAAGLQVAATIEFEHPLIGRQYGSFEGEGEAFGRTVAPARTFGFITDEQAMKARGLARGVTLENAIVLDERGLVSGELRFPDEFVRHKVGDVIGDLALLGCRLQAQVFATRPSHAGNIALGRAILAAARPPEPPPIVDIQKIMQHLPHRYPMLLVDRIVEFEANKRIVGIKNVTINEPFFQGHYPGHPIMPGVLIIEAMAQVGGLLIMDALENVEDHVVYFMSMDKVKWRRPVTPGDQLRFEVEMLQMRRQVCRMKGVGIVDGNVAAEAEFMARIVIR
jgi:UDP-3-O-[3-hydroxymyristoyl] N-acetylglucosamine deacetylase / 3-hydroxyacyl-[acyl-carrier-protein] dehydratase